jgi:hypothetical protein
MSGCNPFKEGVDSVLKNHDTKNCVPVIAADVHEKLLLNLASYMVLPTVY